MQKKTLELLIKIYKLQNIIAKGLDLSGTIDINTFIKSIICIEVRIKIINYGTIYPVSNKLIKIYCNVEEVDSSILI